MSNLETHPRESACGAQVPGEEVTELLEPRKVWLGKTTQVRRLLPHKDRRMVGAWCFVDHYGPDDVRHRKGMWVPPHPHTGLQTVSWLFTGEVLHRDSVGSRVLVRPGELNIMTAGDGIAHSEESPGEHDPVLHGVQLWVALPDSDRASAAPEFAQHRDLPVVDLPGARATVLVGDLAGARSPARTFTPLLGADARLVVRRGLPRGAGAATTIPLDPAFEHAVLVVDGPVRVEDRLLDRGEMLYLGRGRGRVGVRTHAPEAGRVLLLGGEPFEERLVMWWNFIARSHEEIIKAREQWMAGLVSGHDSRFGVVRGFDGDPLPAPPMPHTRLRPRGRTRDA